MPRNTKFGKQATSKESYNDGFRSGLAWNSSWTPGGPFVFRDPLSTDPEWIAYCQQSATNREQYMLGFHAGRAAATAAAPAA